MLKYLLIIGVVIFAGCGKNEIEIGTYKTKITKHSTIPKVCKAEFKISVPRVAVMPWTNNSSFGKAEISNYSRDAIYKLGFFNASSKINKKEVKRKIDSKLSQSVVPLVESVISQNGGAILVSRSDMDKIDKELKFQDSGLVKEDSIVQIGETLGAEFIVTGSINSVTQTYKNNSDAGMVGMIVTSGSDNPLVQLAGLAAGIGTSITDGMKISVNWSIKVIDVQSGQIMVSQNIAGDVNIGKIKHPQFDQVIGAIKKVIAETLPDVKDELGRYFSQKGYILQLRKNEDDIIAQINLGKKDKIKENQIFKVYRFEANHNPIENKTTCDKFELPIKLKATNQITNDKAWLNVDSGNQDELKLYLLIKKENEE